MGKMFDKICGIIGRLLMGWLVVQTTMNIVNRNNRPRYFNYDMPKRTKKENKEA